MFAETAQALAAIKGASEVAKAVLELRDLGQVQSKTIELQGRILAAYESALAAKEKETALAEENIELKREVARLLQWGAEREKYELSTVDAGAFAYTPKKDSDIAKPNHWLCVQCFQNGKKGFLQHQGRKERFSTYICSLCKSSVAVFWENHP